MRTGLRMLRFLFGASIRFSDWSMGLPITVYSIPLSNGNGIMPLKADRPWREGSPSGPLSSCGSYACSGVLAGPV
ncbi:hypothetical protein NDU88_004038 [Pleurodeles waltl]|uniref:Secreted protein n=1 Tax=Pleurodeles waltl TaxID=8319 RepID=A0AAV7NIP4_PLEWA|nr:hypothetical protein NDU88_004038 [Pleurodeles waltl]